jgi:hypothetical protein
MKITEDKYKIKIINLTYKEFNNLIINLLKKEKICFSCYKFIIEKIIDGVIDFYEKNKCDYIKFNTRDGRVIEASDYKELEFEVEDEINYILDQKYFFENNYEGEIYFNNDKVLKFVIYQEEDKGQ